MDRRKHIGLLFRYNENWIGGTYYLVNLVHALNSLPDNEKPKISVITRRKDNFRYIQEETNYPYLYYVKDKSSINILGKVINAVSLRVRKKKAIDPRLKNDFDLVFPNPIGEYFDLIPDEKKGYWIPDFQELHLPGFFSVDELIEIKQRQLLIAYKAKHIVLSSRDAEKDFKTLYPESKAIIHTIPFSVTHPDYSAVSFDEMALKYAIGRAYHFSPNQFWAHKNQLVVIEAVRKIIAKGEDILVIFSGKESDYRNPDHVSYLKKMVDDNGLTNNIKFLGFIDRKEQLVLMKNAISVVQPSLFEGWSTVVEDAKVLNKKIAVSAINVHKEQLAAYNKCIFFDPISSDSLVAALSSIEEIDEQADANDYRHNKLGHAKTFCSLFCESDKSASPAKPEFYFQ